MKEIAKDDKLFLKEEGIWLKELKEQMQGIQNLYCFISKPAWDNIIHGVKKKGWSQ